MITPKNLGLRSLLLAAPLLGSFPGQAQPTTRVPLSQCIRAATEKLLSGKFSAFPKRFEGYAEDTQKGLEAMRNPQTGLIRDKIWIVPRAAAAPQIKVLNNNTSASNIGLDLLNQVARLQASPQDESAAKNLDKILTSLTQISYHHDTGLFYSWYSTDAALTPLNRDVSSVDNAHLALALWTVKESFSQTSWALKAGALVDRMDFSAFYDKSTGLMGGNFLHVGEGWKLEPYRFDNVGSEARSVYAIPYALGLLKKIHESDFARKSVKALNAELFPWKNRGHTYPILKTWDGGAFQLLLPKLLMNEEKYSPQLAASFKNYAEYILAEGLRRGDPVPAAFSASNFGVESSTKFKGVPIYNGQSGSPDLVNSNHQDIKDPAKRELWDSVFTPHAALIAATVDPKRFAQTFRAMENLGSGTDKLYVPGLGFMDGFHVKGPYKGQVVPVQLSLDQGMIALALNQMKDRDGMSPSARAISNNPEVQERLKYFYELIDRKLAALIHH